MSLDAATVRRVARLARIGIEDHELPRLQEELSGILGWIEQLSEVEVEGVAPMVSVEQAVLRLRDDVVSDGGAPDAVLSNTVDRVGCFYTVPKVVE